MARKCSNEYLRRDEKLGVLAARLRPNSWVAVNLEAQSNARRLVHVFSRDLLQMDAALA